MENSAASNQPLPEPLHVVEQNGKQSNVVVQDAPVSTPSPEPQVIPSQPPQFSGFPIKKLLLLGGIGAILAGAGVFGYNYLQFAAVHQETDDAYITADIHPINARVSGTVIEVDAQDNQVVPGGMTLVKLDPRDYQISLQQAQAALQIAKQQAEVAKENITLASQTTTAKTAQSEGDMSSSQAAIATSLASYKETEAGVPVAMAGIQDAKAGINAAQANVIQAKAGIPVAQAAVREAKAGVEAAQANVTQAEANQHKAQADFQRYQNLFNEGVISHQQLDTAKAAYEATTAQVAAVQQTVLQAQQRVAAAQEGVQQAFAKLAQTQQDVTKGQAKLAQATEAVTQAQARMAQSKELISKAKAQLAMSKGGLELATTGNQQTKVSQQQYQAALASVSQAQAQVKNAELQLSYTSIAAANAGQVGNKTVQVGQRVQPGQTLMSVVEQKPWIVANFKETQLGKMKPGQEVEIKIDAFHDHIFKGKVNSLSPASGAKFALLPPDNATGNFTKIVQRVPVKIVFDADSVKGYESQISPGMSAVVSVATK